MTTTYHIHRNDEGLFDIWKFRNGKCVGLMGVANSQEQADSICVRIPQNGQETDMTANVWALSFFQQVYGGTNEP